MLTWISIACAAADGDAAIATANTRRATIGFTGTLPR
jgi:hypothetical protein